MISSRRTRIKFCGMTSEADVALAVAAGADAVGVIVAPSRRRVALEDVERIAAAIPPYVSRVGVLVDRGIEEAALLRRLGFTLQFSGTESPDECDALAAGNPYVKVFRVEANVPLDPERYRAYVRATWMFETHVPGYVGGSGVAFDWNAIAELARTQPVIVSGGLTPENVGRCVATIQPYAVDVRSGIESDGAKDAAKMSAFVDAVRAGRP